MSFREWRGRKIVVYIPGPETVFTTFCDVEGQNGWIFPWPPPIFQVVSGLKVVCFFIISIENGRQSVDNGFHGEFFQHDSQFLSFGTFKRIFISTFFPALLSSCRMLSPVIYSHFIMLPTAKYSPWFTWQTEGFCWGSYCSAKSKFPSTKSRQYLVLLLMGSRFLLLPLLLTASLLVHFPREEQHWRTVLLSEGRVLQCTLLHRVIPC